MKAWSAALIILCSVTLTRAAPQWSFLQSATTANATSPPACSSGAGSKGVFLRHCEFVGYATHLGCHSATDFSDAALRLIPPLDPAARPGEVGERVSLAARYGPSYHFVAPLAGSTPSGQAPRVSLEPFSSDGDYAARATFLLQTGLYGAGTVTLVSASPANNSATGLPVAFDPTLQGLCAGGYSTAAGEGIAVFAARDAKSASWVLQTTPPFAPTQPVNVSVNASSLSSYVVPRMESVGIEFLNHEIYGGGLYAQMVFGESFEEVENGKSTIKRVRASDPSQWGFIGCQGGRSNASADTAGVSEMWLAVREGDSGAAGTVTLEQGSAGAPAFNGDQFQRLALPAAAPGTSGRLGLTNYGLNCQAGMALVAGSEYTGEVYLRAPPSSAPATAFASLESTEGAGATSLAETTVSVPADGEWHRAAFSLTPSDAAGCGSMPDPVVGAARQLATCFGRFVVSLRSEASASAQSIDVDLVELLPGAWGLLPSSTAGTIGLPARRDVAELFRAEGIQVLRNGGTMDNRDTYRWKDFRGPRDARQPYQGLWYRQTGLTQSRRFAMFEIVDVCAALGCDPVLTLNNLEKPSDMADLVEYCWGNASTTWGQQRIADGHPAPYNVTWVEIGNEQRLDNVLLETFVAITAAMDARSRQLGLPLFRFAIGHNLNTAELKTPAGRNMTLAFFKAAAPYGDRAFWDFHIGSGESGPGELEDLIVAFRALRDTVGSVMRAVCFEENSSDHGLARAVGHAVTSNVFTRHADVGVVHGFADAIEAWQGMGAYQNFPQGQIFFAPNASWLQPPGLAIKMIHESYRSRALSTAVSAGGQPVDIMAVADPGVDSVAIRCVNYASGGPPISIFLDFQGGFAPKSIADVVVLRDFAGGPAGVPDPSLQNTLGSTSTVVVAPSQLDISMPLLLDPLSFAIVTVYRS